MKSDRKVQKAIWGCKDLEENQALPARVGKPDLWDPKACLVPKAFPASEGLKANLAARVNAAVPVHAANAVPQVHADHADHAAPEFALL